MKISLSKISRIKTLESPFPLEYPKAFKLVRTVQTGDKSSFETIEIVKDSRWFCLWPSVDSPCFKEKTLDKDFIGSLLVSGPNITVDFHGLDPWPDTVPMLTASAEK